MQQDADMLAEEVYRSLPSLLLGMTFLYAFFAVAHPFRLPGHDALIMSSLATAEAVLSLGLRGLILRGKLRAEHAHPVAALMLVVTVGVSTVEILITQQMSHVSYLMVLTVGSGAALLSWPTFTGVAVLVWAAFALIILLGGDQLAQDNALGLISATVVGALIHLTRLQTYHRLHHAFVQFQAVAQTAREGIVISNAAGLIVSWNRGAEAVFGYAEDEILGSSFANLLPGESYEPYLACQKALGGGPAAAASANSLELLAKRRTGGTLPIEVSLASWRAEGELFFCSIIRDASKRRESERQIIEAKEAALAATKIKSQFLANMSHEIRTPLSGIMGVAGLLLDTGLDPVQRDYMETIQRSAQGLRTVINDILDVSKVEAGKLELDLVDFDLAVILKDIEKTAAILARQKGIGFRTEADSEVGRWLFHGDPGRIRQILTNLVGNATKFTDKGGVVLRSAVVSAEEGSARVRFEVEDTGIGISREALARIFQPFAQADSSTARRFGGTGLGLSISQRLVELMGSSIFVESQEQVGTKFSFTLNLPRAEKRVQLVSVQAAVPREANAARVLVAEDNPVNQLVARKILEKLGCQVRTAADGHEVLRALGEESFDLILMDCHMPDLDGYETTRLIHSREDLAAFRAVPIVALTASVIAGDRERCLAAGMQDYLAKPFSPEDIAAMVDKWHPLRRGSEAAADGLKFNGQALDDAWLAELKRFDQDSGGGYLADLFRVFLDSAPSRLAELRRAAQAFDLATVRREAHALKAAAGNVGGKRLAGICAELEGLSDSAGALQLSDLIRRLGEEFAQVESALQNVIASAA